MELIYQNFDGLDITFQGALPETIRKELEEARNRAQRNKSDALLKLGSEKLKVLVAESGAKGGYRYRFDTGHDGEIWFIADSNDTERWNIRVSVKSLTLAINGYHKSKEQILNRLKSFGALGKVRTCPKTNKVLRTPIERISRFDYCFDFKDKNKKFKPQMGAVLCHPHTLKKSQGGIKKELSSIGKGIDTICVGKMPGKQTTIYNKTKEIKQKKKPYWWNIWGLAPEKFKGNIWRLEIRSGKNYLEKWQARSFKEFEEKALEIMQALFKETRYVIPSKKDPNRSRWKNAPFWDKAFQASFKAFENFHETISTENALKESKEEKLKGYDERINGNIIGLVALKGGSLNDALKEVKRIKEHFALLIQTNDPKALKKLYRAKERFTHFEE